MAGYDNLIFGAGVPGLGSDGIMKGDERLTRSVEVEVEKQEVVEVEKEKFELMSRSKRSLLNTWKLKFVHK
jgi:hypothetical protein